MSFRIWVVCASGCFRSLSAESTKNKLPVYFVSHPIDETVFVAVTGAKYELHVCVIGYGNRVSSSTQQRELMRRKERE